MFQTSTYDTWMKKKFKTGFEGITDSEFADVLLQHAHGGPYVNKNSTLDGCVGSVKNETTKWSDCRTSFKIRFDDECKRPGHANVLSNECLTTQRCRDYDRRVCV